jgi:two-component SAPR family response regulator
MMRDGEVIPASEWRSAGARELFLYLLFAGQSSREEIDIRFWPESAPESIRAKFHTTLYRARQALGKESIIHQDQRYQVNQEIEMWCDALEMEKWITRARMLPPHEPHAADLWERAATIYKGIFLPGFNAEWVYERRDALEALHLEALCGTAASAFARQDYAYALDWYLKAVAEDRFREDNHRAIMRCYAELGYRKQLMEHYDALCEFLMEELGIEPDEETQSLARSPLG